MESGDWIRTMGKSVEVKDECLSACVLVLAGGINRSAATEARIGVHRFFSRSEDATRNNMEIGEQVSSKMIQFFNIPRLLENPKDWLR